MTHHITRRRAIQAAGVVALPVLSGCVTDGDESDPSIADANSAEPGELGNPAESVDVEVTSIPNPSFDPTIVHIDVGGTVTWTVTDGRHDVTAYHPDTYGVQRIPDGAEPWHSGLLSEGSTFDHTFEVPGVYDYVDTRTVCATHEVVGAIGRVIVGWPEGDQPGLEPPADGMPSMAAGKIESMNEETHSVLGS